MADDFSFDDVFLYDHDTSPSPPTAAGWDAPVPQAEPPAARPAREPAHELAADLSWRTDGLRAGCRAFAAAEPAIPGRSQAGPREACARAWDELRADCLAVLERREGLLAALAALAPRAPPPPFPALLEASAQARRVGEFHGSLARRGGPGRLPGRVSAEALRLVFSRRRRREALALLGAVVAAIAARRDACEEEVRRARERFEEELVASAMEEQEGAAVVGNAIEQNRL